MKFNPSRAVLLFLLLALTLFAGCVKREAAPSPTPTLAPAAPSPSPTPPPADKLRLSEVMTHNGSVVVSGQIEDWVELYNADDHPVSLEDYVLAKGDGDPAGAALPRRTLEPGGYALLLCGTDIPFHLSREGVTLTLTHREGSVADSMTVPPLETDQSFTAESGASDIPTPGRANADPAPVPTDGLYISEVLTSNGRYAPLLGEYYDLIELHWNGSGSIELGEYCLSDSKKSLPGWRLPAMTLQSGEYVLIHCTGDGESGAPFALSAQGETLYLSRATGEILDALAVPALPYERSYGRWNGQNVYFSDPTPGAANNAGCAEMTAAPRVSQPSGAYDEPFTVTLSAAGQILYTTDGSDPRQAGRLYGGEAIPIEGVMSLRAYAADAERIPSQVQTWNYMVALPPHEQDVVMLSLSPGQFVNSLTAAGSTEECAANVALFVDGEEQFSLPCGMSVFGSGSRVYEKKSYQINFRARYGASTLRYKLFDDREQDVFNAVNLRSGSQDQCYCNMRDELLTSLWGEISENVLTFSYRPVNLYINGEYRGLYYVRERCSAETVAWRDGVDEEDVDILRDINMANADPASQEWIALTEYIRRHDLSDAGAYGYVCDRLDIDSAVDFFLAEMWSTNYDLNNARVYRSRAHDGKWRFILYDLDVAFLQSHQYTVQTLLKSYNGLLRRLLAAPEFREKFTLRMGELLSGPLAEEAVLRRIDGFAAMLDADMRRNCERWRYLNDYERYLFNLQWMKSQEGIGVAGWNREMIRQYIALVQPEEELISRAFGADWA